VASIVLGATGEESTDDLDLWVVALLQIPLWAGLLGASWWAGERKGNGVVDDFGLRATPADVPVGLLAGVLTQLVVLLLYIPLLELLDKSSREVEKEARELTDKADGAGVLLLVLMVVVAAPVVEELFYRGLVLRSLERRFGPAPALWLSAAVFGVAHFQDIQLPALVVVGLVTGWLAQRTGRLGPSIFAHVTFNGVTVLFLLL
jgi:uncharacterized protein